MNLSKEFNKRKLENKVNNINDSIDALMTRPKRNFQLKKPEEIEHLRTDDADSAANNLEFNEQLNVLPGKLGKEFFSITKAEFDAITGTITDLSNSDIHALRNLQTKLFVTYQYIQDNLQQIIEEDARLEAQFDGVNEKIGELGALLRNINRNKEKIDQEQIENFKNRKQLIHQHSMLNEREKKIEEQETEIARKYNELNTFRLNLEDRQKALELAERKMHVHREKILADRTELDQIKAKILKDDSQVDEKYFQIKKQAAVVKKEKDLLEIEKNTFKNIRTRATKAREELRKAEKSLSLKQRTIKRLKQQQDFQKKAFISGKVNYQTLVDRIDHISNEIDRLENRRSELINENMQLHNEKSKLNDHIKVLRQVTANEVEGLATKKSSIRSNRPHMNA
jgi:hypothetical protein